MNPWKEKVLAYNRRQAEKTGKATDLDVLIAALLKLPPGQLKHVITEEVKTVLFKYGWRE